MPILYAMHTCRCNVSEHVESDAFEARKAWIESRCCYDCQCTIDMASTSFSSSFLPALKGTKKQIARAVENREEVIIRAIATRSELARGQGHLLATDLSTELLAASFEKILRDMLKTQTDASFWIQDSSILYLNTGKDLREAYDRANELTAHERLKVVVDHEAWKQAD